MGARDGSGRAGTGGAPRMRELDRIQNVYVAPEHRRRGHYRRLHEHVRALASRDSGVCGLRLYVERGNADAQAT